MDSINVHYSLMIEQRIMSERILKIKWEHELVISYHKISELLYKKIKYFEIEENIVWNRAILRYMNKVVKKLLIYLIYQLKWWTKKNL